MNMLMLRRYGAEFLGTFAYVFFGCGVKIIQGNSEDAASRFLIYLTFGLTLFTMSFALSHISAAPFNPAITFGLALARRFPWRYVWPYWLAQVLGGVTASSLHFLLLARKAEAAAYGATVPTIGDFQAIVIEGISTFFLMFIFIASATDKRVSRAVTGFATGIMVALAGFFAGPLTGGSMNPARSLAPALFAGGSILASAWVYWVGPLIGASLGALVYEFLRGGEEQVREIIEGQFAEGRKPPRIDSENPKH
jgi:MIP family channel proteins